MRLERLILSFGLIAAASACSSSAKKPKIPDTVKKGHTISRVWIQQLKVRRPEGPGAEPSGGPGGYDYTSHPLPDSKLDCRSPKELLKGIELPLVRQCLKSTKEKIFVSYRLIRDPQPKLELRENDETPECLKRLLPEIPVPREIVFQSPDLGSIQCFGARLNIEADRVAGMRLPLARSNVLLSFPMRTDIETDEAVYRLILAWALTPLWNDGSYGMEEKGKLQAQAMPDRLCKVCLGENDFLTDPETFEPLWP